METGYDEGSIPGAFPVQDPAVRVPKKKFVGRRTAEAQVKQKQDAAGSVEETTAMVQSGMLED